MRHLFLTLIIILLACGSCGLNTTIKDATTVISQSLDEAINKLGSESANIQQIMEETLASLPNDVQATIRSDISNTFQRGISAASSEVRCDIDFIRDRLRQSLQRLKAKILNSAIPDADPKICNIVPAAIDMNLKPEQRTRLEFFGYDFDISDVKVFLFNGATPIEVTPFLSKTTHYHMVLNLGGNGVKLNTQSNKIVLRYKDIDLSTIQIIQEIPDICESKVRSHTPGMVSFIPPHTEGDREYKGHGPAVTCLVTLINRRTHVEARIYMKARETQGDRTTAEGTKVLTIYTPDPGYIVTDIVGPTSASFSYTDNDHPLDEFGGSGPVSKFVFMGDGSGDDAGIHTRVDVNFSSLKFNIKENRDCVDGKTIRELINQNALSVERKALVKKINPKFFDVLPAGQK